MSLELRKEKILIVSTGLGMGGAERSLYNFLLAGAAEKYDCTVLSLRDGGYWGDELESIGIEVLALNLHRPAMWRKSKTVLKKAITLKNLAIIQGWMYHGNLVASALHFFLYRKTKIFWSVRQTLYDLKKEKFLTQLVIKICACISAYVDCTIYNSEVSMEQHKLFGFVSDSILIENGYDEAMITPQNFDKLKFRKKIGCLSETVIVGHVARLHPMKNHVNFINAMMKLCDEKPHVKVLMIGRGVPAFVQNKIQAKYEDKFLLLEETADIYKYMCVFDIFCLSSSWGEGFPNVLAEAMILRVPCVATDVGDSRRILGECGFVLNEPSEESLYCSLNELVSMPQKKRLNIGWLGQERIKQDFSLTTQANKIKSIWN